MKKALTLQLHRAPNNESVKDGGPALVQEIIKALKKRNYAVDSISGNTTEGINQYNELPPFIQRMRKAQDFAKMLGSEYFDSYDLILFFHPSTIFGFGKENFPPLNKTVLFPTLLGLEYARFTSVPREYIEMEKTAFKNNFLIQCPSSAQAEILKQDYNVSEQRIIIQPRGFSPSVFPPKLKELRKDVSPLKPFKVFCANAIRPQKGYENLISLAEISQKNNFPIKFEIYGDLKGSNSTYKSYSENYISKLRDLSLENYFNFNEATEQRLLSREMAKADISIIPSVYETFGKSVLESSASGLPTVVFDDVPAYHEFLDKKTAVFSPRDADSLFMAVKRLATDEDYYRNLSANGISNGKKYYVEDVYQDMLEKIEYVLKK